MAINNLSTESLEVRANRLALLSRLADDLAHEIKNPLHAMVINIELLRRRIAGGNGDAAAGRCDVLSEEVHRLHELVDGILRLFRPSRDGSGITEVELALSEIAPLLERQVRLAGAEWHYSPATSARAAIRPAALVQAVLNLVANALDAMDGASGGRIELDVVMAADRVVVRVRDTGPGLEPAELDGLTRSGARGLGLPVTRALVEEAGGRLAVERPEEGAGARFVLILPRHGTLDREFGGGVL